MSYANLYVLYERMQQQSSDMKSNTAENKKAIIMTALRLFLKKGIRAVRMDDIANEMGISKRTLYELFENKEELLLCCIMEQRNYEKEQTGDIISTSCNTMELILRIYRLFMKMHRNTNPKFFTEINNYPQIQKRLQKSNEQRSNDIIRFFKRGVEEGVFRPDVKYEILNILLQKQMEYTFSSDLCERFNIRDIYSSILITMLRGICTDRGKDILEKFNAADEDMQ